MILNSKYRYIGLDFETTGLDVTKDEPIQIGLIEIDENGKIIGEYQSLIKPDKKTDELKHIVGFITGLSITELETAPTRETVEQEIQKFFGENVIIIGHNIGFDLDFLKKYFPSCTYHASIDTMQLAQATVHYAQSYALEVLIEDLKEDIIFSNIFADTDHGTEKSHDAFFDTKNSIKLFFYFIHYLDDIIASYTNLAHIIDQTTGIRKDILDMSKYHDIPKIKISFPPLTKIAPNNTNMARSNSIIDTDTLENQKKYYIGDKKIKELLNGLAQNKNVILAFQNIQKLDIAKTVLNDMGIKNIGFLKEDQTINQEQFEKFLNKGVFIQEEMFFVIKYLSHLKKGLGVLHFNSQYDWRIYHYIKDTKNQTKNPIILTTHHGLFSYMQEEDTTFQAYDICFFDTENRYKGYNFFLSSPIDLYYTLNILESFVYQQKIDNEIINNTQIDQELKEFVDSFATFIGILFMECTKLFIKTDITYTQHNPIREHSDFRQTNLLRDQLLQKIDSVQTTLSSDNQKLLQKHIKNIDNMFDNIVNIYKKTYGNGDFYFTFSESQKYTDRKEFIDIFKNKVIFLSNTNKQLPGITSSITSPLIRGDGEVRGVSNTNKQLQSITSSVTSPLIRGDAEGRGVSNTNKQLPGITSNDNSEASSQSNSKVIDIPKIDRIIEHIQTQHQQTSEYACFIFSPKKEESKKIFEDLCQNGIPERATLLVENITGGIGKNIFKAKQSKNKILIGGFNFILFLFANKIPLDDIIMFNAKGPSEQNILDDIKWYNIS